MKFALKYCFDSFVKKVQVKQAVRNRNLLSTGIVSIPICTQNVKRLLNDNEVPRVLSLNSAYVRTPCEFTLCVCSARLLFLLASSRTARQRRRPLLIKNNEGTSIN